MTRKNGGDPKFSPRQWRSRIIGSGDISPDQLLAHPNNFRVHPNAQQAALTGAIDTIGWIQQVIVNQRTGHVIDGHLRISLALRYQVPTVPVLYVDLSEEEEAQALLSLDPIAAMAGTDKANLEVLMKQVKSDNEAVQQFMSDLAQKSGIDFGKGNGDAEPQTNRAEELREKWQTETGQLWQIGEHRLICGDCTDRATVERVMGGENHDLMTDPPYGIDAASMTMGKGQSSKPKNSRLSSVDNWDGEKLSALPFVECAVYSCVWGANYLASDLPVSDDWLCWDKKNSERSFSEFELAWTNYGTRCRILAHHWSGEEKQHITQKPLPVIQWALSLSPISDRIVFDPFGGSGTTMVACQNLSRKCRMVEISPAYCAVILERMATAFPGIDIHRLE